MSKLIIGMDVGGTNTDAVIVEYPSHKILAAVKTPTTRDIYSGVKAAIEMLFLEGTGIKRQEIFALNLGTTAFLNAFLECSNELSPIALFRLCGPSTCLVPAFISFPAFLREKLELKYFTCSGGYEFNGKEISKIDPVQLENFVEELHIIYKQKKLKILNIVISGVFSPMKNDQELLAKEIVSKKLKILGVPHSITMGSEFPNLNILRREADAIINESLRYLAQRTMISYNYALKLTNLSHVLFHLVQNDGNLITCSEAQEYPIKTFFSGPTNSLVGAAKLTNLTDAIIVDIGGTSSDIAILKDGNPTLQSHNTCVAGVPTNMILPNTYSIGLGGGSYVSVEEDLIAVGPKSVGYRLQEMAIAFGGTQLTTSDVAIALDMIDIPGGKKEIINLPREKLLKIRDQYIKMLESAIDHVKTQEGEKILILVGGGSVLVPLDAKIKGISQIIRPEGFGSANAYGAALAGISIKLERVLHVDTIEKSRQEILLGLDEEAKDAVVKKGAIKEKI